MKTALITGITGQDGAYLTRHLLRQGYRVVGLVPPGRPQNFKNIDFLGVVGQTLFREVDVCSAADLYAVIEAEDPREIYCLASQSMVWASWEMAPLTLRFNIDSVTVMLEAVRHCRVSSRVFVALSSEVFGRPDTLPIAESAPFRPASPYAISKAAAYWLTRSFRDRYGIFVATGFLFNHESVLRPESYVVKKIIRTALEIAAGRATELRLGNVAIRRDFGYAPEYVEAMHRMLDVDEPDDYIIATGESISIREIVEIIFSSLDIPMSCLKVDSEFIRTNDVLETYGCAERAAQKLGWTAKFKGFELIHKLLVDHQSPPIVERLRGA